MKRLVKLKYIGLVNLILGDNLGDEAVVKEYIQPKYHDQVEIMAELDRIDYDADYRNEILEKYKARVIKSSYSRLLHFQCHIWFKDIEMLSKN